MRPNKLCPAGELQLQSFEQTWISAV